MTEDDFFAAEERVRDAYGITMEREEAEAILSLIGYDPVEIAAIPIELEA